MDESLERTIHWRKGADGVLASLLDREWLVTNGLGGYASGTLAGAATRRYHGLLIAAHGAPLGRVMMFNHLTEQFRFPGYVTVAAGGHERPGGDLDVQGADILTEFRLEMGLPVWRYESHDHIIEKRVFMPHRRNTVHVVYKLVAGDGPVRLKLRPSVHFRGHDDPVSTKTREPYSLTAIDRRYELAAPGTPYPSLRLWIDGQDAGFTLDGVKSPEILYRVEEDRGYEGVGVLWSPGVFRVTLQRDKDVALTGSTETWEHALALPPEEVLPAELARRRRLIAGAAPAARTGFGAELVLAADQFVIVPATRAADLARAIAAGDDARTVIAGYHWFTDWGRDTMISLDGLTLCTGREHGAGCILRTFASHVRDGLIPNYFPDKSNQGVYHTADATLWFFEALHGYLTATDDRETLQALLPMLKDVYEHHMAGTRFGIGVDPADGLLREGADGYQLTWMDAKVGDWVVTPRRGKAVEINALWYNALRLLSDWLTAAGDPLAWKVKEAADRAQASFNRRFWCEAQHGLYDVIDGPHGDDSACRPNQLFAVALPHPILDPARWKAVVKTCHERLYTPVGLRSLAPGNPDFKPQYYGDLRSRDAAYHQGTVWAWLIGPFIDAWLKVFPGQEAACRKMLAGFQEHFSEACVGSISEIFDAEPPYTPRGCVAQAWSVAEVLRCWVKTAPDSGDPGT
ncbi:MAG TPA: amylo-alpha-1,6-glucosidase [Fimbriiglobus sp.]|nr:amylo-alpha-1,6-glucosidase [Fimbriiglobus sp.]